MRRFVPIETIKPIKPPNEPKPPIEPKPPNEPKPLNTDDERIRVLQFHRDALNDQLSKMAQINQELLQQLEEKKNADSIALQIAEKEQQIKQLEKQPKQKKAVGKLPRVATLIPKKQSSVVTTALRH